MLTREQKAWIVTGYCNTDKGCSDGCALYDICKNNHDDFIFCEEAELDACLKIIAPNVLDESESVAMSQWISVEDKLPEAGVEVLTRDVYGDLRNRSLYVFNNATRVVAFWPGGLLPGMHITHWMPIPEPTKE